METPTVPAAGLVTPSSRVVAQPQNTSDLKHMYTKIPFDNTYAQLPERFFVKQEPASVPGTEARPSQPRTRGKSSRSTPTGWKIAQAYAGHQFGGFSAQLGDGRAILLGEVIDTNGARHDLQLKGSGRTPFSRGGDGKSALGPVIREYIVSEAMAALGVLDARCGDEHSRR